MASLVSVIDNVKIIQRPVEYSPLCYHKATIKAEGKFLAK
jgi:hypothetical protein